jgi:tetratricopeptide (TPR) repeat protein
LAQLGKTSEALNRIGESEPMLDRLAANGVLANLNWFYYALARASLLLGRRDEARRLGERALEFCSSQPGFAAHAQHLLGDVAAHPDQFDAARGEVHYRQALGLAEGLGMHPLIAHCHNGLGKVYLHTGKRERAEEYAATAATMYGDMGMTYWLEQAEAEMRQLQ